ncbi:helix-turn-helix transcriptional regulator [Streptomyces californicus]|uniref:helix-turn-helix domain-containing protein n=1 Tax=Streptomyces californicus TaxID=67351 RepID=UPI00296F661B|nr:helix-turn-helix transcriptional regulator [Streptomyces californicus]MDW4916289.1 helix-turn-helix transcriptional regulator [Streptomyces californicus]
MDAVLPSPAETLKPPAQIVIALYLRLLREARGIHQAEAADLLGVSVSSVSRLESAETPIQRPEILRALLRLYGVKNPHMAFLVQSLPPKRRDRVEIGFARRALHDHWADVADTEATARHIAVMRSASEVIEFCLRPPAGLRTQAYEQLVLDPETCAIPDVPVPTLPTWVHKVGWAPGQRRTVILDEVVLTLGGAHAAVVAAQLRHLAALVDREEPRGDGLRVRILPLSEVVFVNTVGPVAEVTLYGQRMVASIGLFPSYETGSGAARSIGAGLREALHKTWSREETQARLRSAAEDMERKASP